MKLFVVLLALSFGAKQNENVVESDGNCGENMNTNDAETIFVKIEEDEFAKINKKERSSQYVGVSYDLKSSKWTVQRHSKHEKKNAHNGIYGNEETAAHASDSLARKLMTKGEKGHKLNFPYDNTEVLREEKLNSSQYIGVTCDAKSSKWQAQRHSKLKKNMVYNGRYENEERAAHASDTLARKLMANGEKGHKLNFPNDDTEVYPKEKISSSQYIGVNFDLKASKWQSRRRSKKEKKMIYNGRFENEERAAHASDTLARKLMTNGEQNHKLNFPDDDTEVFAKRKRKKERPNLEDLGQNENN